MALRDGDETEEFAGVEAKKGTDKAVLCAIPEHGEQWIPRSQIAEESEVQDEGDTGTLVVSAWIAKEKGLV